MSKVSPSPQKTPFFSWGGPLGKFVERWNRHQKWWWIGIVFFIMVWFSYDVGQLVARADLVSGSSSVQGVISIDEALKKSEDGGRLIITSSSDARFIDSQGRSWNIPDFAKTISQGQIDQFEDRDVKLEGGFSISVRPIKTKPSDLLLATVSDIFLKLLLIGFYATIFYFIMRHFNSQKKGRFNQINSETAPNVKIADVAGYDGVKNELLEVVDYLRDPDRFTKVGARPPRGVLLYGPPGTGKTLLAKAVAGEAAASFFEQSASSFIQVFAGEGAKSVRQLFEQARKSAPAVIFIDEIDAVGGSRSGNSHDERVQTLNAILTEMDGFADNQGIVVVAATNRIDTLDKALVRPGRFDRKVWIGMPTLPDREKILRTHAQKIRIASDVDWAHWAAQTKGFSGAELAALVNEAAIEAARQHAHEVTTEHIEKARDRVWIGAKNHGQVLSDHEREIIAIHELGHAWMRLHTGGKVEKVSVSPRGQALGVTVNVAEDERFLHSYDDVKKEILMLMGGRAAEEVVFGHVTGGAADDMQRASSMARSAIIMLGSKKWGSYIPENIKHEALDDEAAELMRKTYEEAVEILKTNSAHLRAAAGVLQNNEEMSGAQLQQIWPSFTSP